MVSYPRGCSHIVTICKPAFQCCGDGWNIQGTARCEVVQSFLVLLVVGTGRYFIGTGPKWRLVSFWCRVSSAKKEIEARAYIRANDTYTTRVEIDSSDMDSLCSVHRVVFYVRIWIPRISRNFGACANSAHQALLSPHEREPGFEASHSDIL